MARCQELSCGFRFLVGGVRGYDATFLPVDFASSVPYNAIVQFGIVIGIVNLIRSDSQILVQIVGCGGGRVNAWGPPPAAPSAAIAADPQGSACLFFEDINAKDVVQGQLGAAVAPRSSPTPPRSRCRCRCHRDSSRGLLLLSCWPSLSFDWHALPCAPSPVNPLASL